MFENPLEQVNKFNSYLAKQTEEEKQRKLKQQAYNAQQKQALSPTFSKKMVDASDWQQYESAGIRPLTAKEKMNINVPYSKSEKFPTLTKQDENFIMQQAGGDSVKATDVYKLFMESKSARDFLNAREWQRNDLAYKASKEKDPEAKSRYELIIKGSQLADIARKERLKEWFNDVSQVNDEQILTNLLQTPEAQEGFTKYINNQISLDDMAEIIDPWYTTRNKPEIQATQKEQEKVEWTILGDIVGWIAKSWTATAEIGANIGDWLGYNIIKATMGEEKANEAKARMWDKFGETIDKTLAVLWVDQDSFAYKAGKFSGDTAQIAAWGSMLKAIPTVWKGIQAVDTLGKTSKWMQISTSIAKWAIQWATDTAMYDAIANKEVVSGKELAVWGAIGWAIGGISWAVKVKQAGKITKAKESVDKAVWQIVQWDAKHIEKAKNALLSVDTKWVKDYKWLSQVIWSKKVAVMESLDDILATNNNVFTPKDTTIIKTVGANWVKTSTNHVWKMIDDLVEYYTRNADDYSKALIEDAKITYQKWWLSLAEINNLAREYGVVSKAFTKTWDPLTSVTKQAFENTRKWVKTFIRSQFDNDAAKLLDQSYSQLETTQMLVDNMAKKVNALQQKVMDKWFIEKVWEKWWEAINFITQWWLKALMSKFLPSNIWLKTMNSLEIEKHLAKNLRILEKAETLINNGASVSQIQKVLEWLWLGTARFGAAKLSTTKEKK